MKVVVKFLLRKNTLEKKDNNNNLSLKENNIA